MDDRRIEWGATATAMRMTARAIEGPRRVDRRRSAPGLAGRRQTGAGRSRPRAFSAAAGGLILVLLVLCQPVSIARAQVPKPPDRIEQKPSAPLFATPDGVVNVNPETGIVPAQDRDAESWLRRAAEAADRKDWKLVADTLDRIIRDQGSTLVLLSDGTYRSAIEMAQAQIAALPPEGLQAYRILFDPAAKRLLEQSRVRHDLGPLRRVARVYPQTTYGPEALDLLTVRLLDAVEPGEALAFLNQLDALAQTRVSKTEINLRRAVAFALLRRPDRAKRVLDAASEAPDNDEATKGRIATIRSFVDSDQVERLLRSQHATTWATRMGPTSVGIAGMLDPLVHPSAGGKVVLPSKDKADPKAFREVCQGQGRPPVWQVVSDGGRVFVTCPRGLIALDAATFATVWQATPATQPLDPKIIEQRRGMQGFNRVNELFDPATSLDDYTTMSLFLEYRGAVSTAQGLVFIIGQRKGLWERNPSRDGICPHQPGAAYLDASNALVAYDADTGVEAWVRGNGRKREDVFVDTRFYSTPIPFGDNLLVTYVRNGDLYLGELTRNGDLVKEVAIGTGRTTFFPMYGLLEPTIANGSVYVPSGAGLLTALYAHDLSLRWLARYKRAEILGERGYDRPGALGTPDIVRLNDDWLSSPPVQAGAAVILAPQDANEICAFDAETGKQLWSQPRGTNRYIVGATDDLVVIAGKSVSALRVKDGQPQWTYGDGGKASRSAQFVVSGRPQLLEEQVLVPTFDGLVRLDLATGEPIGERAGQGLVLGNLRAFDGALYSVGNTTVSKYTDPVRAQQIAMERLKRDPNDVQALQRLAWLAGLRSDWKTALDWLDRADAAIESIYASLPANADDERAKWSDESDRVSHYRVTDLIAMADEGDDATRSRLLTKALAAARTPVDQTAAGLALASHEFATGEEKQAGELCVRLLADAQGLPLQIDDRWRIQDALEIGRRLRQFYSRSSAAGRALIDAGLEDAIAKRSAADDRAALVRLSDALAFIPLGAKLDLEIADREKQNGLFESAVHHLNRAIARADAPDVRESAMARLALLCVAPPESIAKDDVTARRLLHALGQADGATSMSSLLPTDETPPVQTLGEFVNWCADRLPDANRDRLPPILGNTSPLALMTEAYIPTNIAEDLSHDMASFWDPKRPYPASARAVPVLISGQYRGISADAVDLAPTRWLHDPELTSSTPTTDAPFDGPRYMTVEDRVGVLVGPAQVEAIGLDTGRAIWTPIPLTRHLGPLPTPPAVSGGGIAVVATDPSTIVAACVRDGAAPLWRRTFPDRQLGTLSVVDGRLVCVDVPAHRAAVIEMETGLLLREYDIPVGGKAAVEAAESADTVFGDTMTGPRPPYFAICGSYLLRTQGPKVIARRAATGEVAWELEFADDDEVKGIGALGDEYAAIYHGKFGVKIVAPGTGHEIASFDAVGLDLPPIDAVVHQPGGSPSPRLMMFTMLDDDLKPEYALSSFPLSGDAPPWRREFSHATISPQMMRASPDYVAVVTNKMEETAGLDAMGRKRMEIDTRIPPEMFVLNTQTGRRIGPAPYSFNEGRLGGEPEDYEKGSRTHPPFNKSRAIRDVVILDHRIIAFAPEGYYVLADKDAVATAQSQLSTMDSHDAMDTNN